MFGRKSSFVGFPCMGKTFHHVTILSSLPSSLISPQRRKAHPICEFGRKNQAHEPGSLSPILTVQNWLAHKGHFFASVLSHTGSFMKQFQLKPGLCIACAWWVHARRDKPVLQSGLFYNEGNLLILHLPEAERCRG